jgi:hypothetical protein
MRRRVRIVEPLDTSPRKDTDFYDDIAGVAQKLGGVAVASIVSTLGIKLGAIPNNISISF